MSSSSLGNLNLNLGRGNADFQHHPIPLQMEKGGRKGEGREEREQDDGRRIMNRI